MGLNGWPIKLHWVSLKAGPEEQERLTALLSPAEADRAQRYRKREDRRRYVVRRGRLRELCGRAIGCSAVEVPLADGPFGKPFIEAPGAMRFNLSHSGDLALMVFADNLEIGCDIEWLRPGLASRRAARTFFSPREQDELAGLDGDGFERAFFACWTRKEALVKGMGLGLTLPLQAFDVATAPDCEVPLLSGPAGWSLRAFEPAPGLCAAIAVCEPAPQRALSASQGRPR